eukprot:TRINITY_DN524_c0_g1_i1.p2 TRINITY_DN524_c0_g1~~TRINITY_DN524_c0_g1_i1.p2  ORF type:complete len:284 (-),score=4.90 TRINITY_DN524_c0_g1_i1:986-1837(-)
MVEFVKINKVSIAVPAPRARSPRTFGDQVQLQQAVLEIDPNMVVEDVLGDGLCGFHCYAHLLGYRSPQVQFIRDRVLTHIRLHRDEFSPIIEHFEGTDIDSFLDTMSASTVTPEQWTGPITHFAAAQLLDRPIVIIIPLSDGGFRLEVFSNDLSIPMRMISGELDKVEVPVAAHVLGYVGNNHYCLVTFKGDNGPVCQQKARSPCSKDPQTPVAQESPLPKKTSLTPLTLSLSPPSPSSPAAVRTMPLSPSSSLSTQAKAPNPGSSVSPLRPESERFAECDES